MEIPTQNSFKIFFSWQSDVDGVHYYISNALTKAASMIKTESGIDIYIDEATRDLPGSPEIVDALTTKIRDCDVFVADVTPIQWISRNKRGEDTKLSPNPNVLFELGYAVALKGWGRIILLCKIDDDKFKNLPFDINHNRSDLINLGKEKNLKYHLLLPINEIIDHQKDSYPIFFDKKRLDLNIKSKKYLPEIFVGDYDFKQGTRLFVDPYIFYSKEYQLLKQLNFDYVNRYFQRKGENAFELDLTGTVDCLQGLDFSEWRTESIKVSKLLREANETISCDGNKGYMAGIKLKRAAERFDYASKQIMLVTGTAGQGKTNFICDLVSNILLPRKIPFLWINGYEIDPSDFEGSILRKCLHSRYTCLKDSLRDIEILCHRLHKPLIIIIDGLNEITFSPRICDFLNSFIASITNFSHVRLIMTCREEYYDNYFNNYGFSKNTIFRQRLNDNLEHDEDRLDMLLENYCEHFGILMSINKDDKRYLSRNLLHMRIFCEVNAGKKIVRIDRRKYQLFEAYYSNSLEDVAKNLNIITGETISKYDVEAYFDAIIALMVEKREWFNIPVKDVTTRIDIRFKGLFERFLDENILVKRELGTSNSIKHEVVSFTYDEFRDYLIAHYLVDEVLPADREKFIKIIDSLKDRSITEGVLPFLFIHILQTDNKEAKDIINGMPWYGGVLALNFQKVDDDKIKPEDIEVLKSMIALYPMRISWQLLGRWNLNDYPRPNIITLIDYVSGLNDSELKKYLDVTMPMSTGNYTNHERVRDDLFNQLNEIIREKYFIENPDMKYLFEYLLIFFFDDPQAADLLNEYLKNGGDGSIIEDMKLRTSSVRLRKILQSL